jgi:hypothetical protein
MAAHSARVCFTPNSDRKADAPACLKGANTGSVVALYSKPSASIAFMLALSFAL